MSPRRPGPAGHRGLRATEKVLSPSENANGEFAAVVYAARFTANDQVTLRVVFRAAAPHQIGGFFYK